MERYGDLRIAENWMQLLNDCSRVFSSKLGYWNTELTVPELLQNIEVRNAGALLRYVYQKEASHDNAKHIFVKENQTFEFAVFLLANFPRCKFLISVRDPRDMALSWRDTDSIPGGIKRAVDTWINDQKGALALHGQLNGTGKCKAIRYEDLLADTENCLGSVLDWLGMDYEKGILDYHQDERTVENSRRIRAWSNLEKGLLHNNFEKYKSGLSSDEIRYIELRCASLMEIFGYSVSENYSQHENLADLEEEIAKLERTFPESTYNISPAELEIRKKRLREIDNVLKRKRQCLIAR